MPKRFANGGNGRKLDNIAKSQDLTSGSGKSNYFKLKIEDLSNDIDNFKLLCHEINNIQDAIIFKKALIKLQKNQTLHNIFHEIIESNHIIFTQKNYKNFLKVKI